MLVEDVRVSQKLAQSALTRAHYKVEVASDGETAVDLAQRFANSLRIVLMDINLPGINGIVATQRIRQWEREHGVKHPMMIFGLTGHCDASDLVLYEQAGMNGCIMKGNLLADSVRKAADAYNADPHTFVNLTKTSSPSSSPNASPRQVDPIPSPSSIQLPTPLFGSRPHDSDIGMMSQFTPQPLHQPQQQQPQLPQPLSAQFAKSPSVAQSSVTSVSASVPNILQTSASTNGPDCLLVEDVRVSQRIAQQALSRAGFRVEVADNGRIAVDKFIANSGSIRVILMDVNLPEMSGIEATEVIRRWEIDNHVVSPVMIFGLTGNVDADNLQTYEEIGMDGCILKGKLLIEAVKTAIVQRSRSNAFVNLSDANVSSPQSSEPIPSPPSATTASKEPSRLRLRMNTGKASPSSSPPVGRPIAMVAPLRTPEPMEDDHEPLMQPALAEALSSATQIGTPRISEPRELLNKRLGKSSNSRPGIGLPSSRAAAMTANSSPPVVFVDFQSLSKSSSLVCVCFSEHHDLALMCCSLKTFE